ncbi:MAG TPA: class I SAM-dependent methyltransferase [Rhodocyclaceae bacterium]|nr:class I SAM-dependent methyltransferase [Rhodocyclaceae bacterium]
MSQDKVFLDGEGDAWFRRNAEALSKPERPDWVLDMLAMLGARAEISTVCEVGCADGWRLARIAMPLPQVSQRAGFDASAEAIANGKRRYKGLDLRVGSVTAPPFTQRFDLVIVSFVLHWIDRAELVHAIAAIDGLVAPGGWLAIADFLPERPCKRRYHHRDDIMLYTFKQDYAQAFTGLGLYEEVARVTFPHSVAGGVIGHAAAGERANCTLLRKPLDNYPES